VGVAGGDSAPDCTRRYIQFQGQVAASATDLAANGGDFAYDVHRAARYCVAFFT
jgi:hypothetical protein